MVVCADAEFALPAIYEPLERQAVTYENWSLRSLQQRLFKTGKCLIRDARYSRPAAASSMICMDDPHGLGRAGRLRHLQPLRRLRMRAEPGRPGPGGSRLHEPLEERNLGLAGADTADDQLE